METIYSLHSIYAPEVGKTLFDEVSAIYPEGRKKPRVFESRLPQEDLRTQRLMETLERSGYKPRNPYEVFNPAQKYYKLQISREYSGEDLAQTAYLRLTPRVLAGGLGREGGKLVLLHDYESNILKGRMTHAEDGNIVVTDALRRTMEEAGILNLVFAEAVFNQPRRRLKEPLWEMTTDLRMPPLSSGNVLIDNDGQPYAGLPGQICLPREGLNFPEALYFPAALHYRAEALAALEPFDLARTHEPLGQATTHYPVASQRFYQFCLANGLQVDWEPVLIDEDR